MNFQKTDTNVLLDYVKELESNQFKKRIKPKIDEIETFILHILLTRPLVNDWYPIPNGKDDPPLKNVTEYGKTATYSTVARELIDNQKKNFRITMWNI